MIYNRSKRCGLFLLTRNLLFSHSMGPCIPKQTKNNHFLVTESGCSVRRPHGRCCILLVLKKSSARFYHFLHLQLNAKILFFKENVKFGKKANENRNFDSRLFLKMIWQDEILGQNWSFQLDPWSFGYLGIYKYSDKQGLLETLKTVDHDENCLPWTIICTR